MAMIFRGKIIVVSMEDTTYLSIISFDKMRILKLLANDDNLDMCTLHAAGNGM
jgi:hypothetical protein